MVISSEVLPLGGGTGPNGSEALGQNSFERFTNVTNDYQMPSVAGRSVSHEEGLVAMALLGCAGKRPPGQSGGGERMDSGAWGYLLAVGGENVQDLELGGRKIPDSAHAHGSSSSSASGINDPKAQRQKEEQERRQQLLEEEALASSMPSVRPFGAVASSRSSSNSRSSSRKARLLSRNVADDSSAAMWPTTSSNGNLYSLWNYKSSSGSGSSGGGGPPGDGGGRGATANAGGSRSSGNNGGGASWERSPPYSGAIPSTTPAGAGGSTTTHDGVIASSSGGSSNSKFDFGQHPLRQQSFQPDGPIADLPSAEDICQDQPAPLGGVREWEKAAAAATITTTITASQSAAVSLTSTGSGVFVARDRENTSVATSAHPAPTYHGNNNAAVVVNTGGPIAPAPAPRVQPPAARLPAPAQHKRKPSYNLLAMMIPDISKFGSPPTAAAPLHAPGAGPGAPASGGAGFPAATGFTPAAAAAARFSPADSYFRVGVEDGGKWTRQAALARYRRKKKRRHLVKIMRENDPHLQEQNDARRRPRKGGKFTKERPDFVSICEVQKAAKSRSSSGELPLRESTPPPQPSTRRGSGRSARAKSQAVAGTRASARGGGAQEGSNLYRLTPSEAAKLGLN